MSVRMCGFRTERERNKIKEAPFVTQAFLNTGTTVRTSITNSTPHKDRTLL